jgi:hypothetical protein
MTAAGATLAGLGVLVGVAIGSGETKAKLAVQATQPVDVRTEVIRKTINVYRKAKPHHVAAGPARGPGSSGAPSAGSTPAGSAAPLTRSSGAAPPAASAAPVVSTRTSGASSSGGSSGSSHTVSTRSSGGGGGDGGGGHDD